MTLCRRRIARRVSVSPADERPAATTLCRSRQPSNTFSPRPSVATISRRNRRRLARFDFFQHACRHVLIQHFRVPVGQEDDTVEGYHLFAGGGFGANAELGQEVYRDIKATDAPKKVERLLKAYLSNRLSADESFLTFARRHDAEALRKLADAEASR